MEAKAKEKVVLGIDPGVNGAYCVSLMSTGLPIFLFNYTSEGKANLALTTLRKNYDIVAAILEDFTPMPGKGGRTTKSQGVSQGIWRALLVCHAIPYELVYSQTWQKAVLPQQLTKRVSKKAVVDAKEKKRMSEANRKRKKAAIGLWVSRKFPNTTVESEDQADAICIACYALKRTNA